jgi:hypothetical protein
MTRKAGPMPALTYTPQGKGVKQNMNTKHIPKIVRAYVNKGFEYDGFHHGNYVVKGSNGYQIKIPYTSRNSKAYVKARNFMTTAI